MTAATIARAGVVGAGFMGTGIAESAAAAGVEVVLYELTPTGINTSQQRIEQSLERSVEKGKRSEGDAADLLRRITWSHQLDSIADAELVIEAVVEDAEILIHCFHFPDSRSVVADALAAESELFDVLPEDYRAGHLEVVGWLRELLAEDEPEEELVTKVEEAFRQPIAEILAALGQEPADPDASDEDAKEEAADGEEPTITCTSLVGAKGLSAGYVFMVGMCDGHFPQGPDVITDDEICKFLVGLSRTRKECHVVSCRFLGRDHLSASAFLRWIEPHLVERKIDAAYFKG